MSGKTHLPIPEVAIHVQTEYLSACCAFSAGGIATEERWKALGHMLGNRPGWRFAIYNSDRGLDAAWLFGDPGGAVIVVHGEIEGFRVFDYFGDSVHVEPTEESLRRWLQAHEADAEAKYFDNVMAGRRAVRDSQDGEVSGHSES